MFKFVTAHTHKLHLQQRAKIATTSVGGSTEPATGSVSAGTTDDYWRIFSYLRNEEKAV